MSRSLETSQTFRTVQTDICIAGAGIIGLSLALELRARGLSVIVLDAAAPMREASTAAAGMLAADDPHNPPQLSALSHLSISLYPEFLERIARLSGTVVPFQTSRTLQAIGNGTQAGYAPLSPALLSSLVLAAHFDDEPSLPSGFKLLHEQSIDPRQLAASLLAAAASSSIVLFAGEPVISTQSVSGCVRVSTSASIIEATNFVDCTGAWFSDPFCNPASNVIPIKGQMLSIAIPKDLPLHMTIRASDIYIVPRTTGPNAGRAIIGATIEDVGFDKTVHAPQIEELHRKAAVLLPQLSTATIVESWSGLRPATSDRLPILGAHPGRPCHWIATGHYRNGILLAPATARVMAEIILGQPPSVSLEAFRPARFS